MKKNLPLESQGNVDIPMSKPHLVMTLGMEFGTEQGAYNYYNEYASGVGFSIRREFVNKNKVHGYVTSRKFSCWKEGYRGNDKRDAMVKKHRKETRTGCMAHIIISRQANGKYVVTSFQAEHNHPFVSPKISHLLPSQRKIENVHALEIDMADDSGICPKSSWEFASRQAGGPDCLGYTRIDHKNYLRDKRKIGLKRGEAATLLDYFENQRIRDPAFYFSIQLDEDDLIGNIFWADSRMINDYSVFGDVVSFDTTYRTNKDYRPLALFVGMNNHRQMVVFGAALLYDETIESFKWLFEVFLRAMCGKKPKTFLTDQDRAMSKAISLVMPLPETYHRLCIWHLEQNAAKHLNYLYKEGCSFASDFKDLINSYEYEEEFVYAWNIMLEKHGLEENQWLSETFELREKWSMAYGRNTFSAGMKATQLSESFNGSLRGFLKSDLDLVQFFKHFERAVNYKQYNEMNSNYDMTQRIPIMVVDIPLLKHAREIYTATIFYLFEEQWKKSLVVVVKKVEEEGEIRTYYVISLNGTREHKVTSKPADFIVSCSCKLFEFMGILCCHCLKALDLINVKMEIPKIYISKSWTKDVSIVDFVQEQIPSQTKDRLSLKVSDRYRNLCSVFVKLVTESVESKEGYELGLQYTADFALKLKELKKGKVVNNTEKTTLEESNQDINNVALLVDNANVTRVMGIKRKEPTCRKNARPKSFLEKNSKKKKSARRPDSSCPSVESANGSTPPISTLFTVPVVDASQGLGINIPSSYNLDQ